MSSRPDFDISQIVPALLDPRLTRDQAVAFARSTLDAGIPVDQVVARFLARNAASMGDSECPSDFERLLSILFEISSGASIVPELTLLARQSSPFLQSKAVLMIGRINQNAKWVQNRLAEPDFRVRANAIEALWGVDTAEVRQLMRSCAGNGNNRVVGNALLGLYRLGDCWAIPEILKMAGHSARRFRATAAWLMGETGDPRFIKPLARMLGEPNAGLRTRAFAALGKIKIAAAKARQSAAWRIIAEVEPAQPDDQRAVAVVVLSSDGADRVPLLATQLMLSEDGQEVSSYQVEGSGPYTVRYRPVSAAAALVSVRAQSPAGFGETTAAIPPPFAPAA